MTTMMVVTMMRVYDDEWVLFVVLMLKALKAQIKKNSWVYV